MLNSETAAYSSATYTSFVYICYGLSGPPGCGNSLEMPPHLHDTPNEARCVRQHILPGLEHQFVMDLRKQEAKWTELLRQLAAGHCC
jgi:hypothetical protein